MQEPQDNLNKPAPYPRGLVLIPNISEFSTKFNNIAKKHNFTVANKVKNKVRDLASNAVPHSETRIPT